jgi:type IV pilus assembly protein PilF
MFLKFINIIFYVTLISLISACGTTQKTDENKASLKMQLGVAHLENDNLPLALKELLEAEQLDPKNPLIQNNLGLVYFLRKKMDLSLAHYTKATELNPQFTEAKNNLARVYIEVKQYQKAEVLLKQVVEDLTYPNQTSAYMNFGLMRFNQKRFIDAKSLFRKVLESAREYCYAQVYLGRSFLEMGENLDAVIQLEKAIPLCIPRKVDEAHYYSAIAHYRLGQKEKSLARFQEAVRLFPEGQNLQSSKQMILIIKKGPK